MSRSGGVSGPAKRHGMNPPSVWAEGPLETEPFDDHSITQQLSLAGLLQWSEGEVGAYLVVMVDWGDVRISEMEQIVLKRTGFPQCGWLCRTNPIGRAVPRQCTSPSQLRKRSHQNHPRRARTGSVRVARRAGNKHAASETVVMTASAVPKAIGSSGLTL